MSYVLLLSENKNKLRGSKVKKCSSDSRLRMYVKTGTWVNKTPESTHTLTQKNWLRTRDWINELCVNIRLKTNLSVQVVVSILLMSLVSYTGHMTTEQLHQSDKYCNKSSPNYTKLTLWYTDLQTPSNAPHGA